MNDEPGLPAAGHYACEHTRAWSRKLEDASAFVFVTQQYNWGYPAPLKNALEHLYAEWAGKPAAIVTCGGYGGGKCAHQLGQVLEGRHMIPVAMMPNLTLSDPAAEFAGGRDDIQRALAELLVALERRPA